jgi:hypothetical protein
MKKVVRVLACIVLSFIFGSSETFAQKYDLKLMTGPMGGSWYPLGGVSRMPCRRTSPA